MSMFVSAEEHREILDERVNGLIEEGVSDHICEGGVFYSLQGIRPMLRHLPPASLIDIGRQVSALEDKVIQHGRQRERWASDDAATLRGRTPLTEDDRESLEIRRMLDDAAARAARAAAPMTQAQAAQLIALNERIANALERK
jgi:hypothetical protein